MKKCIITQSAVEAIQEISSPASKAGKETGGILIGPTPTDSAVFITSATGPGPDSNKASYASWETDPVYLNEMLKAARDKDASVNLRGFWHLHPGQMTRPSGQDLSEAQNILLDTEHYKLNGELVMPIVTATDGRIVIHCYYITSEDPQFREMPMEVVPDEDEMVKSMLSSREAIEIEEESDSMFWQDENWQFYRSSYGIQRLEEELQGLSRAGYEATARLLGDGSCCVQIWEDEDCHRTLFLLPREYPLNPPRVFTECGEDIQEIALGASSPLHRWSSVFHLADLAGGVLARQVHAHNHTASARFRILADMRGDFREGNCNIRKLLRQLAGLVRGEDRCA